MVLAALGTAPPPRPHAAATVFLFSIPDERFDLCVFSPDRVRAVLAVK
jgi:hypothetical protein